MLFYLRSVIGLYYSIQIYNNVDLNNLFKFDSNEMLTYNNIYNLARMSLQVYDKIDTNYRNISLDDDGVRAYLFANENESEYVIAFKGTSFYSSRINDKFNDNLFFSCCYYKETYIKCPDCIKFNFSEYYNCSKQCYKDSLKFGNNYYNIVNEIYKSVLKEMDSKAKIYLTGHSLGAAMANIIGVIYNVPSITFSSPNIKHYLDLLEIKYNKSSLKIYNFGINSDPIFMGTCNGMFSTCYYFGYIMKTKCNIGYKCIYDSKNELDLSENIYSHKLKYLINKILPYWEERLPRCEMFDDCVECEEWRYN
jgi:lipase ATG15